MQPDPACGHHTAVSHLHPAQQSVHEHEPARQSAHHLNVSVPSIGRLSGGYAAPFCKARARVSVMSLPCCTASASPWQTASCVMLLTGEKHLAHLGRATCLTFPRWWPPCMAMSTFAVVRLRRLSTSDNQSIRLSGHTSEVHMLCCTQLQEHPRACLGKFSPPSPGSSGCAQWRSGSGRRAAT
jgi:hypothetical protein